MQNKKPNHFLAGMVTGAMLVLLTISIKPLWVALLLYLIGFVVADIIYNVVLMKE